MLPAMGVDPEPVGPFFYHQQDQQVGGRQINHARSFDAGRYPAFFTRVHKRAVKGAIEAFEAEFIKVGVWLGR